MIIEVRDLLAKIQTVGAGGTGQNARTVLNGTANPTSGIGYNGDFYINTTTNFIFGPKASGAWPAGISLVGPSGQSTTDSVLVGLLWGSPGAESANAIEISATIKDFTGVALASSLIDVEVMVTDGAADNEPSHTATLSAADTPVGTVLGGSGTATMSIRSASGSLALKVTETLAGNRYLWVKQSGNARLWVRSLTGVQELVFT